MSFITSSSIKQINFEADDPRHSNQNQISAFESLVNYESDFQKQNPSSVSSVSSTHSNSSSSYSESLYEQSENKTKKFLRSFI